MGKTGAGTSIRHDQANIFSQVRKRSLVRGWFFFSFFSFFFPSIKY